MGFSVSNRKVSQKSEIQTANYPRKKERELDRSALCLPNQTDRFSRELLSRTNERKRKQKGKVGSGGKT